MKTENEDLGPPTLIECDNSGGAMASGHRMETILVRFAAARASRALKGIRRAVVEAAMQDCKDQVLHRFREGPQGP